MGGEICILNATCLYITAILRSVLDNKEVIFKMYISPGLGTLENLKESCVTCIV